LNRLSGGDSILDIDLSNFTGYSNSGKIQGIVLYVGSGTGTAPNPLTYTNPLPVVISSGSNIVVLSGAVQLLSGGTNAVGVLGVAGSGTQILQASGSNFVGSVLATIISGSVSLAAGGGGQASGAVQVSGIVGVSGSVGILSGQLSVSSGLVGVLSGSIAAQVSGAVIVSGNVGISGSTQILSGAGIVGLLGSGGFPIGTIPINSGLLALLSGSVGAQVSGAIQVSGIVGVSGSINILSGQVSVSSGLVGVLSGSIAAQVSGAVNVSGNVGISGSAQILSGSAIIGQLASGGFPIGAITSGNVAAQVSGIVGVSGSVNILSGLVGILSGSVSAQVSGSVIVSGNVGISGSVQLLSGSAWVGITQGVFSPVAVGPASGQPFALQVDGSGNLQVHTVGGGGGGGGGQTSGAVQVSGIVGVSGSVNVLSGQISVSSGSVGATVSGNVAIGSGLVGILSGQIAAQVSGSVIVSGNVGVSGAVRLLSGSAVVGNINIQPGISGGLAIFRAFSGLTNQGSGIQVQSGTGQFYAYRYINLRGAGGAKYLKFYDTTAAPGVGTDVPFFTKRIAVGEELPAWDKVQADVGIQINNGLWVTLTNAFPDSDTTPVGNLTSGLIYAWVAFKSGY